MSALRPVLDAMPGLDVLVVGDALLDDYLRGGASRICREAPVPVVTVDERRPVPGGAGNLAANLAALGARVRLLCAFSDDADARTLQRALDAAGVPTDDAVVERGRVTVAKRRVVAGDQLVARFDEGAATPLRAATRQALLARLPRLFAAVDVVVVSDYGYGVLDDEVVDELARLQAGAPRVLVVDARDASRYRLLGATAVKPNYDELRTLLGEPPAGEDRDDRAAAVAARCAELHDATGAQVVAVTLDADGAVVCERGRPPYRTWARPAPGTRASGAGDSYTGAFALALGAGADVCAAAEIAQAAAAVVTARDGTSTCPLDDLRAHLADTTPLIEPLDRLAERAEFLRRQGRRVVFTNGCFDVLHRGHVDLLNRAKTLGDVLVVGLNGDAGIRRLKGPDRPINRLEDRASVLAGLSAVDHLVAFDDDTATAVVERLRPDVYVKGGDYTPEMVPEAPAVEAYGGVVRILPYLEDRSTTRLIERIRGAGDLTAAEARR